jgi:hypothetical protein
MNLTNLVQYCYNMLQCCLVACDMKSFRSTCLVTSLAMNLYISLGLLHLKNNVKELRFAIKWILNVVDYTQVFELVIKRIYLRLDLQLI